MKLKIFYKFVIVWFNLVTFTKVHFEGKDWKFFQIFPSIILKINAVAGSEEVGAEETDIK